MNKTRNTSKAPLAEFVRPRWVCAKGIDIFKMVGKKSERGLQNMGLMETVEIREERADSHRSHKPGENARRGKLKEEGVSSPQAALLVAPEWRDSAKITHAYSSSLSRSWPINDRDANVSLEDGSILVTSRKTDLPDPQAKV